MVRVKSRKEQKNSSSGKTPALRIVQLSVATIFGLYVAFFLRAPSPTEHSVLISQPQEEGQGQAKEAPVIGYAVSVTGCGSDPLVEGAAVLKHSIHLSSVHGPKGGSYDYQMYAIYHPNARDCSLPLKELGYTLLERNTPVSVSDIRGEFLRTHIEKNGCCGEKELIKLEAYTLTQHPVVVHLDLDVLVLKPLDGLFDAIIHGKASNPTENIKIQFPDRKPFPDKVNAFYTRDYNMNRPGNPYPPMQGGFLVVRPDMAVYNEYLEIIKEGDFRQSGGWGGKVGAFYGGQTIQGLVPYYYDILHPETFIELDHCEFNQMCINPRDKPTVNDVVNGRCRTGEEDCPDCRSYPFEKVITTHYTLCQKPWWCLPHDADRIQERLCRKLLHAWNSHGDDPAWEPALVGAKQIISLDIATRLAREATCPLHNHTDRVRPKEIEMLDAKEQRLGNNKRKGDTSLWQEQLNRTATRQVRASWEAQQPSSHHPMSIATGSQPNVDDP